MKKLFFFVLSIAGGTMLSAQTLTSQSMSATPVRMAVQKMVKVEKASQNITPALVSSMQTPAGVSAKAALKAHYWRPSGTLYASMNFSDGKYYPTTIVGAAVTDWVFINASTGADRYEWTINNEAMDADSDNNGIAKYGICKESSEGFSGFYIPELTAFSGSNKSTYAYGAGLTGVNPMAMPGWSSNLLSSFDPSYLADAKFYLSYSDGSYIFGSGDGYEGEKADCMAIFYEKPQAPLYIKGVSFVATTDGTSMMPSNGTLTVKIIKTEENKLTSTILGEAVMHAEDMEESGFMKDGKTLPFKFTHYDPETGLTSEAGITVDTEYAIAIYGFNEPGYDVAFPALDKESLPYFEASTSYAVVGDKYYYTPNADKTAGVCDMMVNIDAMYNCLSIVPETNNLIVPDAGGNAANTAGEVGTLVYSTMQIDETGEGGVWVESASDWLSVAGVDDTQYEQYRVYGFVIAGEALPVGGPSRWGEVVLASYGAKCTIRVGQGPDAITSAIVNNVKAVREGDNFRLTYDASMTSVQVMNAAGQLVANHNLDNGGTFVMSAANLANGLYILKFNGETTATVKVMK